MRQTKMFFLLMASLLLFLGCPKDSSPRLFMATPKAASYSENDIKNLMRLGSHIVDKGVSFNLYSENATRIELLLFDDPESNSPSQVYLMSRFGNVWSIYVEGIGKGIYYGYRAWGPNWPYNPAWRPGSLAGFISDCDDNGHRFNPNKVLMDPYGRAYHRDHDWFKGNAGTGPHRAESTMAAAAKTIVVQDGGYQWSAAEQAYWTARQNGTLAGHNQEDLIIYEVNLKGFTKNLGGDIQHPGTFRGAGEYASYLKDLGITAVEFLPVQEAGADGGYWKYWTTGFFAPEVEYAYRPEKASQINEFKWMVEQYHAQGIEVIIDVVFNHTGEGGLWRQRIPNQHVYDPDHVLEKNFNYSYDPVETATIYSFRGIDNRAYYTLSQGQMQFYYEKNGVGNMLRANHTPGRKLILDCLRYWVEEMHVDGFRFDLASNLGYGDQTGGFSNSNLTWSATNTVIQDIADDPILKKYKTRIIAEAWDTGGYNVGQFSVAADFATSKYGWAEWNGAFRDYMRTFINQDDTKLNSSVQGADFGNYHTGNSARFGESGDPRAPLHSVNFITAHDGYTLYDFLSYGGRRNVGAPLNPDGIDPDSGDEGLDGRNWSPNSGDTEEFKRQMYRNLVTLLFLSHGTPMMLGGDEWMRTQFGNTNPYHIGADNTYNWFRWNYWKHSDIATSRKARWRMFDFYKKIIAFRKSRKYAFAPTAFDATGQTWLFSWKKADNTAADGTTWGNETIGMHYYNTSPNKQIYICLNMEEGDVDFTLPAGITWELRIDTQAAWDPDSSTSQTTGNFGAAGSPVNGTTVTGGTFYGVKARSICVFEEQ